MTKYNNNIKMSPQHKNVYFFPCEYSAFPPIHEASVARPGHGLSLPSARDRQRVPAGTQRALPTGSRFGGQLQAAPSGLRPLATPRKAEWASRAFELPANPRLMAQITKGDRGAGVPWRPRRATHAARGVTGRRWASPGLPPGPTPRRSSPSWSPQHARPAPRRNFDVRPSLGGTPRL